MKMSRILRSQSGFTLVEIIAVLVILGILAAVAIPRYLDLADDARKKAAVGQIAEIKGALNSGVAKYMLQNNGAKPTDASAHLQPLTSHLCPTADTTLGDFTFKCTYNANSTVTIHVTKVQGQDVTVDNGTFTIY